MSTKNKKPSNPFAFPSYNKDEKRLEQGLTMRDYFAIKLMAGTSIFILETADTINEKDISELVQVAYKIADQMLIEREK